MKNYLLPQNGNFYKANLHCHSTISDGSLTPEQLKDAYKSRGYSILAITDHERLVDHSNLDDDNFLTLTSYEIEITGVIDPITFDRTKTCHLNLFAKDQHNTKHVCLDMNYIRGKNKEIFESFEYIGSSNYKREYTPKGVSEIIKIANENGFLVSYNHPQWSLENLYDFGEYDGMFAMEVCNYSSCQSGIYDHNIKDYETLLRMGKKLFCTATDDNHNKHPFDSPLCDSFGGFVNIKAEKLAYKNIIDALEKGDFYASCGPAITSLYIEDSKAYIECEPAKNIIMSTMGRNAFNNAAEDGHLIESAVFDISPQMGYIRFDVVDDKGNRAYTRAYYPDEF